ncbi:uncharacterized protein LOC125680045 [Ostrea edulis]|uniref:uncharacterized protein LOC125680045 n=1 Tax=Ostrea edulis TaxID=37623 RepID=UPI0024AFB9B2|nr:uncharacterized protein LOC125680045 [Ostrea edulis]
MSERIQDRERDRREQRLRYLEQHLHLQRARELQLRRRNRERLGILQQGRGLRNQQQPRRLVSEYYHIQLDRDRHSRKFKVKQNVYNVTFRPIPDSSIIRRLFRDLLQKVKLRMQCNPNDYVRLNIRHPALDSDIWVEFTQSKNLNEEKILNKIEAVQQSKKEFVITDGSIQLDFFHVKYPQGSGGGVKRKHLHVDKEKFKTSKRAIVRINNPDDSLCLPRAIVVARLHSQKPEHSDPEWEKMWLRMRKGDTQSLDQKRQALALMELAGCANDQPCGPQEWEKLHQVLAPEYRLKIFQFKTNTQRLRLNPIYRGQGSGKCLNILLDNEHYDTITSMPGVTENPYYCDYCDIGYSHIEEHRTVCPHRCSFCLADTPCSPDGTRTECSHCKGFFRNAACYQTHLKPYSSNTATTVCNLMGRCDQCQKWMSKQLLKGHACGGKTQCRICKKLVTTPHFCFVQKKPKPKRNKELKMYIYFDFECTQENGIHTPNLCVAERVCQHCDSLDIDTRCDYCHAFGSQRRFVFQGPDTLKQFMDWLLQSETDEKGNVSFKHDETTAIAHNFKGYDGQFILNYLVHTACIKPAVILNGSKILCMGVFGLRFIDSYNFLPFALAKMPSAFGLTELKKGYFPHFFNKEQNQNYVGPYPDAHYYNPDDMSIANRAAFYTWYNQQAEKVFDFQKEFLAYCISDVDILRRCCAQFKATLYGLVRVDPFQESITFASTANLAYRRGFMTQDTIAIIPNMGYQPSRRYSAKACRWLTSLDRNIRHAKNGGEITIGPYTVDGYDEESHTVYEFYGCYWHGCPTCYPNLLTETHPHRVQQTYQSLYEQTLKRAAALEQQGYTVVSIWEHVFDRQVKNNPELQTFLRDLDIQDPLNPRDALYGGRTNATRLYCEEGDMRYVDVCSLYPYVLKYRAFPIDHPQVITSDFADVREYFGLIRCRVLPPRGLYHPVLPYKTGGKLLFPLCRTCAEHRNLGPDDRCSHTDSERSLTGTWVTVEVHKALDLGYRLERIHEVWHFEKTSQDLFRSYIDTFLKIKQESSGFPDECQTPEQKQEYISEIRRREGIFMNLIDIEKNPVRRTIAKLFLNCLWGKFAQRLQLPQTQYLTEEEELQKKLQDATLEIKGVELLENRDHPEADMMLINYQEKEEFLEDCPFGNVVLACFTTAHARLHLYETLEPLGDRVLYFDTDSIIYQHDESRFNPTIINSLGGWTDELSGDRIVKYMSGGPKNYAYETQGGKSMCKVKGLTLNYRASRIVSLTTLEKMLKGEEEEVHVRYPHFIQRTRQHDVRTSPLVKKYRVVYDKRQRVHHYNTLPYGY